MIIHKFHLLDVNFYVDILGDIDHGDKLHHSVALDGDEAPELFEELHHHARAVVNDSFFGAAQVLSQSPIHQFGGEGFNQGILIRDIGLQLVIVFEEPVEVWTRFGAAQRLKTKESQPCELFLGQNNSFLLQNKESFS